MSLSAGTLAFCGFGASGTMRYYSPSGVQLSQPPNDMVPGTGVAAIQTLIGTNAIAIVGGNTPNFPTTGTGTFNSDGSFHAQYGGASFAGQGGARDDSGYFYSSKIQGGGSANIRIFKYDVDCTLINSWTVSLGSILSSSAALAVNGAGTIAYVNARKASGATVAEVYAVDLAGAGTSLGVFASDATSASLMGQTCLLSLTNGDVIVAWRFANNVKRYNSSGVLQSTYTLPGSFAPLATAYGLSPTTTFWVGAVSSAATFSGVTIYEVRISDGVILNQFDPEDGTFQFDSAFTVLRAMIVTLTTPPPILVNSDPSCVKSSNPATNIPGPVTSPVGPEWISSCVGGGVVPTAADLVAAEVWDA